MAISIRTSGVISQDGQSLGEIVESILGAYHERSPMGRLAIRQDIPDYFLYTSPTEAIESAIIPMLTKLGGILAIEFAMSKTPVVTKLSLEVLRNVAYSGYMLTAIADLQPVQSMDVRMLDILPPFEFSKRSGYAVEWQCAYCGQVNLVEEHLECRRCGAARRVLR